MELDQWKKHSRIGWAIATGSTAMFAARIVSEIDGSFTTKVVLAGCAGGMIAMIMQTVERIRAPKAAKATSHSDLMSR